jgi:hypothetical protein
MALPRVSHPSGHRVHSHQRWKYTLAAEKAALSRNDPNSVARHSHSDDYYGDDSLKPKPVSLPKLMFLEIPPSGGD